MSTGGDQEPDVAPSRLDDSHVVGVCKCDSAPLLWRMTDVHRVRGSGLVGALLGSLPRTPRQNARLGRPLLLLPEEERLLSEQGAVPDTTTGQEEGEGAELRQRVEHYQEEQQRNFEEQRALALADRKAALLRAMSSSHAGSDSGEALQRRLEELEQNFTFPQAAQVLQINTARAEPHRRPRDGAVLRVDRPVGTRLDGRAEVRYQVFKDLRGRGFYLTSAGKFGGDFLVYPGDPLRFHAHFIAVCVSLDESLALQDLLVIARLGSNVKKTVLLCSGTHSRVRYTSLQWSGMA